ncbi:hypothetical protein EXIGLDRAFT_760091 [Exidia glandulosa HHB12029]|uniref:Uncharacterized protein n=1 Tax=Exidia glandulosa HHB12029 TaxID=1314781 RepID=A0A165PJ81_EXIGL|nr:hypothetical protein EXIGLDRAFT_760091 [Exidia glandulosa HHB12029]
MLKSPQLDLTRKRMLLKFINKGEEYNLYSLVQVFDVSKDDDHGVAALMIIWARLCVDEGYRCNIFDDWLKCSVIASAIERKRCDCCIVAGLHLVTIILYSYMEDLCWKIVDGVLPTLLDTLAHTPADNLVHELCLRVIEKLAESIYCDPTEDHARKFMCILVRWLPRTHHPSHALVKTVMRSLTIITLALQTNSKLKEETGVASSSLRVVQHDEVVIEFFVGLFRFGYPRARRLALRWLTYAVVEDMSDRPWRPGHLLGARERQAALPAGLRARMERYGWESCDSVRLARCIEGFCDAFIGFTIKRDVRSLALRLFCVITEDPRCVRFDDFFTRRTGIGKRKPRYYGVDCDTWVDILHHCAASVRALSREELLAVIPEHTLLGHRTALDVADVFSLAHTIISRDRAPVIPIALDIGERKSGEPFLAYTMAMIKEAPMLEMSRIRDFYSSGHPARHHALAQSIITKYFQLVIGAEGMLMGDGGVWADGVRDTYATRDLCVEYLNIAPPDARERCSVLEIYISLQLFIWGPDEPDTLTPELKEVTEEWRSAVKLNEQIWGGACRDEIGGLGEMILNRLPAATEKWREPLRRASAPTHDEETEDDFEADFDPPLERPFSKKKLLHWQRRVFAPLDGDPPLDWAEMPRKVLESFVHPTLRPLDIHECASCKLRTILSIEGLG